MLKRFKKLKGIGRFSDADASGRSFEPKTVIYANNGNGKSTLTAIIRSLSINEPKLIKQRSTFGSTTAQKAQLVFGDATTNTEIEYDAGTWRNHTAAPKIEIFDGKFISQNIFDGEQLAETHKANLHRVVIGEEGKVLAKAVAEIKENLKGIDAELLGVRGEYARTPFSHHLNIDKFSALTRSPDIDEVIGQLEAKVNFARIPGITSVPTIEFDLQDIKTKLSEALQQTHIGAKEKALAHVSDHWLDPNGRVEFLEEGLSLIKDGCPFCGQSLENVGDLIDAYRNVFDEAYKVWEENIRSAISAFGRWNFPLVLNEVETRAAAWSEYLPTESRVLIEWITENKPALLEAKDEFDAQCRTKFGNLAATVEFASLETLDQNISELNSKVIELNAEIDSFKAKVSAETPANLAVDLEVAKITKQRQDIAWIEFCERYENLKQTRESKVTLQNEKLEELQAYSTATLAKHQTKINEILDTLRADFRIDNLAEKTDRRRNDAVSCGFNLKFFNAHDVSLDTTDDESPTFHNTLSQGDKNLLAFAFFISSLSQSADLSSTIIVIDDPISSFDHERKQGTVSILARLTDAADQKPEQMIILTHEIGFLDKIYNHSYFDGTKYLRISPDGVDANGCKMSKLEDCNPWDDFLRPPHTKYLEDLKKVLDENLPVPSDASEKCRKVLEAILRTKYPLELKALGRASSIGDYVQALKDQGVYNDAMAAEFDELKGKLHEPHHAAASPVSTDSEGDLSFVISETLRLSKLI